MTPAQVDLLKRLIKADREYRTYAPKGMLYTNDDRGVEIGWISGVDPRTARSLEEAGLIEIVQIRPGQNYAFLGKYNPVEE